VQASAVRKQEDANNQWMQMQQQQRRQEQARQEQLREQAESARAATVQDMTAANQEQAQSKEQARLEEKLGGTEPPPDQGAVASQTDANAALLSGKAMGGTEFNADMGSRISKATADARSRIRALAQVQSFNEQLKRDVEAATDDLNRRNVALLETTRQMVAMQQQLLQAQRLATVGQMASTFAHEIGSPMSALSVQAQLLLEDSNLTAEQRETIGIIRKQIQTVVQIVNDLLRSARRGPTDFVSTDLNATLDNVLQLVRPKLVAQRVAVNVDLQPLPAVRGYPLYLQEAFLNLISNASDAMPGGGRIEVKSWYDSDSGLVNVRISDTGPGIDPSVAEHIFDHFVTTKEIGRGTGLGLAIVKEIIENHRGTVRVDSKIGSGTVAHIVLPADAQVTRAS